MELVQNFWSLEKKIKEYALSRIGLYFDSPCYRLLYNRIDKLTESFDMKTPGRAGSLSKLSFPLLLERKILMSTTLNAASRAEPLIGMEPIEDTSPDNARNAEDTVNQNLKTTRFRNRTLRPIIDFTAGYGCCVQFTDFRSTSTKTFRTVAGDFGTERKRITVESKNVYNSFIHPLNYIQDPSCADFHDSSYRGHMERINLSVLNSRFVTQPDLYIKSNFEKAVAKLRKSGSTSKYYFDSQKNEAPEASIDLYHFWGTFPIPGNEESTCTYYCQIVGDEIIRFQDNPIDDDVIPYTVYGIKRRHDYWWYNTDVEFVRPHEQLTNFVINAKADNLMSDMMRYLFFQKGAINTDDLRNRVSNGGLIGVDMIGAGVQSMSQIIQQFAPVDTSTGSADWLMQQVNQNRQAMSTKPDLMRSAGDGGPQNKTATGATILQSEADLRESDIMDTFSEGITDTGEINFTMLQQFLPDEFSLRPRPNTPPRTIMKEEMMGRYNYLFHSSMQRNKIMRAGQLASGITQLVNFQKAIPQLAGIDFIKPVRELIRSLDMGNVDEILQENINQGQPIPDQGQQALAQMGGLDAVAA
jgi:hypothetical protein